MNIGPAEHLCWQMPKMRNWGSAPKLIDSCMVKTKQDYTGRETNASIPAGWPDTQNTLQHARTSTCKTYSRRHVERPNTHCLHKWHNVIHRADTDTRTHISCIPHVAPDISRCYSIRLSTKTAVVARYFMQLLVYRPIWHICYHRRATRRAHLDSDSDGDGFTDRVATSLVIVQFSFTIQWCNRLPHSLLAYQSNDVALNVIAPLRQ